MSYSVVPYVNIDSSKYLPLPIIQNAAQLLTDVDPSALELRRMSPADCDFLNELCRTAGLQFIVDVSTSVVDLLVVCAMSYRKPIVRYLPNDDPFGNAIYFEMHDTETLAEQNVKGSTINNSIGLQIVDVRGNSESVISQASNPVKVYLNTSLYSLRRICLTASDDARLIVLMITTVIMI